MPNDEKDFPNYSTFSSPIPTRIPTNYFVKKTTHIFEQFTTKGLKESHIGTKWLEEGFIEGRTRVQVFWCGQIPRKTSWFSREMGEPHSLGAGRHPRGTEGHGEGPRPFSSLASICDRALPSFSLFSSLFSPTPKRRMNCTLR